MCNYKTYPYLPLHHLWLQKEAFHLKRIYMAYYINFIETKNIYLQLHVQILQPIFGVIYACVEGCRDVGMATHKNSEQIFILQYLSLRGEKNIKLS